MTRRTIRAASLFVLTAALLPAAAFINGSFETPVISGFDFSTVPTGWVKTDPTNSGLFLEQYSVFSLPTVGGAGNQAYGFGGNGVTTGNLAQTFDTVARGTYQVTFQYLIQQGGGIRVAPGPSDERRYGARVRYGGFQQPGLGNQVV